MSPPACPSEDTLALFLGGQLQGHELEALEEHLADCRVCGRLIAQMVGDDSEDDDDITESGAGRGPQRTRALRAGAVVGRYVIRELLGAGGMGVVYAARDPRLQREVALKIVRSRERGDRGRRAERARLLREARAMASLSHPNVVAIYDVGLYDDGVYVAMELVEGTTLQQWLTRSPPPRHILDAFVQAGRGLAAAHARGIVHRDFKPGNVMIDGAGRVRVLDFGLAKALTGPPTGVADDARGRIVGTPAYMAPEQLSGLPVDARADQFSFCVSLYEALVGKRPFVGDSLESLAASILAADPPPPGSAVPQKIAAAVLRGLRRRPAERFESMDVLLDELQRRSAKSRRRVQWGAAAGSVVLVAATSMWRFAGETRRCEGIDASLDEVLSEALRRRIRERFAGVEKPDAADTGARVEAQLDRYAAAWADARRLSCEATPGADGWTQAAIDDAVLCLTGDLQRLGTVAEVLADGDVDALRLAAERGLYLDRGPFHDGHGILPECC